MSLIKNMSRFNQLDGMRGLFSIVLIFFHFPYNDSFLTSNFFVRSSDLFVDFFFVLSGFVITYSSEDKIKSFLDIKKFLNRRLKRLYPMLFFSVISFVLLELVGMYFLNGVKHNSKSIEELLLLSIDTLSFFNSVLIISNTEGMNYPSWSISAEMISYTTFALCFLFPKGKRNLIFAIILFLSILFVFYKQRFMFTSDFGFVRGFIGFLFGYFTYQIQGIHKDTSKYETYCLFSVLLLFYICNKVKYEPLKLLFPVLFSITVYVFANSEGLVSKILKKRFFQFLGEISYSIYLNHALLLIVINVVFFRICKLPLTELMITLSLLVSVVTIILYSTFTFRFIEKVFSISNKN